MENHHFIAGKINYFDWAIFNSYVKLPEGRDWINIGSTLDQHWIGVSTTVNHMEGKGYQYSSSKTSVVRTVVP
jgi:hypothetical protein